MLFAVTLVTAGVMEHRAGREARQRSVSQLEMALETARQLEAERADRLALQAEMLTDVLPLAEALAEGDRGAAGRLLDEFAGWPRTADTILVLDRRGEPLAAAGGSLSLRSALTPREPPGPNALLPPRPGSLIAADGHLYGVLARPLTDPSSRAPLGTLVIAEEIGVDDATNLARLSGSQVVLLAEGRAVASTLPLGLAAEVGQLAARLPVDAVTEVELRGRPYLARLQPLPTGTGAGRLLLSSLTPETSAVGAGRMVLLLGLAGALIALPLLYLGGYRLQRALSGLSEVMAETAATGRLERDLATDSLVDRWASPEVGRLEASFHSLMQTVEESLRDRERSYVEAVGAVVAAIDARDHETTGHSFRVAHYALTLAKALGSSTASGSRRSSGARCSTTSARSRCRTPSCARRTG